MSTRNRLSGDDSKARSFANGERYPATSAMKDGTTTINMDNAVPILGEQHLNASVNFTIIIASCLEKKDDH